MDWLSFNVRISAISVTRTRLQTQIIWTRAMVMVLTSLSTTFHLYRDGQFYWWRKPEYPLKTTDMSQVTDKLCTRMLHEVHLAMSSTRTHNWVLPYDHDHDGPLLAFDFSVKLHWRHWQCQPNIILNFVRSRHTTWRRHKIINIFMFHIQDLHFEIFVYLSETIGYQ